MGQEFVGWGMRGPRFWPCSSGGTRKAPQPLCVLTGGLAAPRTRSQRPEEGPRLPVCPCKAALKHPAHPHPAMNPPSSWERLKVGAEGAFPTPPAAERKSNRFCVELRREKSV